MPDHGSLTTQKTQCLPAAVSDNALEADAASISNVHPVHPS